ncbi:hypothetical protein PLESTB_000777300 [Pleodorina starrii]|uniref:Uncharacterized protein n=1 Tax=Pleodorina starrii TaxID=330485 RepID=A0A9W6BK32_9CHLO|nr:hypothetical protein PLESTM_000507300 [Pleodorina starrii]GLC53696.1 hypothetical protein PLESTB_000777300 [Pleodorina starrii]GLC72880.1 hypothetical protein PLESTF_001305300 [Pleodorina starrii]
MGALMSTLWAMWFGSKEYKIVMVGLDNAGKTTILYKLHLGEVVQATATVGSNVELVRFKNIQLEIWDLGGQQNLRPFWATYFKNTDAVVMVVDSTDRARVGVTKSELFNLLESEELAKAPILVYANKQDLRDAMTVEELTQSLMLHSIRNHDWHIQACCALTGEGLLDGINWIYQRTKGNGS